MAERDNPATPRTAMTFFMERSFLFGGMNGAKNPVTETGYRIFRGDPAGIRTPDPLLKRQLLCRLSYRIRVKHLLPINHWPRGRIHGQWQGRLDSNQRMRESKSLALPLGYAPKWKKEGTGDTPAPSCLGWVMGLEPTTPGTTIQCSAN